MSETAGSVEQPPAFLEGRAGGEPAPAPGSREIQHRLAPYLGVPGLNCEVLASGWETTVFQIVLAGRASRFADLPVDQPLVLRLYQGPLADDKGAREAATMRLLAANHYPVPYPYLFEPDHEPLGAPFLLMDRVRGVPLFSIRSLPLALKTFTLGFIPFVRAQAELHRSFLARPSILETLPRAYGCATVDESAPLVERMLGMIAERIERGPLPGLRQALERLRERAPRFSPAAQTVVHMDYHPQNVIVSGARVAGVIDWVSADRGDRYLCAAMTAVILSTSAMEHPRWMRDNPAGNTLRFLFASMYVPLYHALMPMEFGRFRFAQAVAALMRLSMFGMMRVRGAESAGFRREAIENVTPDLVRLLSRYTAKKCGVPVHIDSSLA